MNLKKRLANNVRKLLAQRKMTSEMLAYEYDISKGYMSDIVNGKANVSIDTLEKLAKGLKTKPYKLLL